MKCLRSLLPAVLALAVLSGCYKYKEVPSSTLAESYTQREKDERDHLFDKMTSLTRADAQRIAIINNPNYVAAYHAVSAARMRYYQAMGAYSPTINAGFNLQNSNQWYEHTKNQTSYSDYARTDSFTTTTSIGANLLLFDGMARYFKLQAAKHGLSAQEFQQSNSCRTIMQAVAMAYNEVLLAIENRRIAEEDRKFQLTTLQDTEYKFQAGAVPLSDVLNFKILMNNADVNMISADYQYETAVYALAVLMGYPEGTLPKELKFPTDFKEEAGELPPVEIYLDAALNSRPDLKSYREQLEIARYQLYQTYSAYSPTVNGYVKFDLNTNASSYHKNPYYSDLSGYTHSYYASPTLSYGLTADWTIFNGFIRYNTMREYQANLAIADYQVASQWFTVVNEVRTAYASYIKSVNQARIQGRTKELSSQQRDLVDEEYRAGNAELTRLNEAQRDLVTAESNLASSLIAIQNAKAQLDAAVGVNTADFYLTQKEETNRTLTPGLESYGKEAVTKVKANAAADAQRRAAKKAKKAEKKAVKKAAVKAESKKAEAKKVEAKPAAKAEANPAAKVAVKSEAKQVTKPAEKPVAKPVAQTPAKPVEKKSAPAVKKSEPVKAAKQEKTAVAVVKTATPQTPAKPAEAAAVKQEAAKPVAKTVTKAAEKQAEATPVAEPAVPEIPASATQEPQYKK